MAEVCPFMREAALYDTSLLLGVWRWIIPPSDQPLFISAFGDWLFAKPDRSLWVLSLLDGEYFQVAKNPEEYDKLNKSAEWREEIFLAGWFEIANVQGLNPSVDECWSARQILYQR